MARKTKLTPREKAAQAATQQLAMIRATISSQKAGLKALEIQMAELAKRVAELNYQASSSSPSPSRDDEES